MKNLVQFTRYQSGQPQGKPTNTQPKPRLDSLLKPKADHGKKTCHYI